MEENIVPYKDQDFLIEQLMSLGNAAGEVLQKEVFSHFPPKPDYRCLYIPKGPDMYTGMLKAAGYLLIDKSKPQITFLVSQTTHPKSIIQHMIGAESTYFGKKFLQQADPDLDMHQYYAKLFHNTQDIIRWGIGEQTTKLMRTKLMTTLLKNKETNIIIIDDMQLGKPRAQAEKDDDKLFKSLNAPAKKTANTPRYRYQELCTLAKREIDVIGYLNSHEYGNAKSTNSYACLAA